MDCRAGREEKSKTGGREIQGHGGEKWQGGGFKWDGAERVRKGVANYIVGAKDMDYVTGKFGDVGKMARLSGGPLWRGTE